MVDWLAGKRVKGTSSERTSLQNPILGGTGVGGWVEVGRTTVTNGSTADIDVTSLPNKRYYMVLTHLVDAVSGQDITPCYRFGSNGSAIDTGNNYAKSWSGNGSTPDSTQVNQPRILTDSGYDVPNCFMVGYIANYSNKDKLLINHSVPSLTGANAPYRAELAGKWVNGYPIDKIRINEFDNRTAFDNGSEVVVLGYDPSDTHTTNFWEELYSDSQTGQTVDNIDSGTFTNKKYLWVQLWVKGTANTTVKCTFNNSTDSTYAYRYSNNGSSDTTVNSSANVPLHNTKANATKFINMFIVNDGSNEPLAISHCVEDGGSGANVDPDRRETVFKRSTTTAITDIEFDNDDTGNFTDWEFKIWGAD
jgi:hypothetical protein